uniref:NADH dehydrogenase subunit 6 n=1 Tax=Apanteles gelechiidivoris TaxID=1911542 RepID=UPI00286C37F7|nr:NADH dehydrogenase subunit 6 [Apanteles gelechiidivoris]WKW91670.1 NADH dehydrogenase subunit 6 [Apanteles gelechiidivoris]WLN31488.1 NADH dehydrogenase subunit 6 [Apanteles gelechiidivoris]
MMKLLNFLMLFSIVDLIMLILVILPSNLFKFHPLIFSILLFLYSIFMSLKLNYLMSNFFYSYILFLIMVGGVMILIMYFTSISSNEFIFYSKNYIFYFLIKLICIFILIFMFLMFLYFKKIFFFMNNYDLINFKNLYLENFNFFILKNLYMNMSLDLTIFFIIYLFMMMMFSTMICLKFNIPMRQLIY